MINYATEQSKSWHLVLASERRATREQYVLGCPRTYHLGNYWQGKFYLRNAPVPSEAIFRARAFAYSLANLPVTIAPEQALAAGMETYQTDTLPAELEGDYSHCVGAFLGRGQRNFRVGFDHTVPAYDRLLVEGFRGFRQRVAKSKARYAGQPRRLEQLEAMDISLLAMSDFCRRVAAANQESEPVIAARLERIAEAPPCNFADAVQLVWLVHVMLSSQRRSHNALGRLDQYLYPFYRRDLEQGVLDQETALDWLCHLFAKIEGMHEVTNICIGGLTPEGRDATNELSFLILQATEKVRSPSTNISARLHDQSSEEFHLACIDVIRTGVGFPALFNDEVTVPMLVKLGIPKRHARDYCMVGCVETLIPGKQQAWSDSRFNTQMVADRIFDRLDQFANFEEMLEEFFREVEVDIAKHVQEYNASLASHPPERLPDPALSALTDCCIERGRDINAGGARFKRQHGIGMMGLGTIVDSLAAVKKLVFEEKQIAPKALMQALANDFQGQEPLRQMLLNRAPKYGNDDDYVDSIAVRLVERFGQAWLQHRTLDGGHFLSCMATNVSNIQAGEMVKATPDGRRAFTTLSDAASPYYGRDKNGPTAFLNSISKPDYSNQNCTVVNMRFQPEYFASEEGSRRFLTLTREFVRRRAHQMQFNVTDDKTLLAAQKNPEQYANLVVRVSGFSAYFTRLTPTVQNDIMRRRAH